MRRHGNWITRLALLSLLFSPSLLLAAPSTPEFPGTWLNSAPLRTEQLRGKLVVLYFFEEGCPTCASKWPERLNFAKQYADQPVVFIAVNSGMPPQDMQKYLRTYGVTWPTIVDTDRSFEKAMGINTISLNNIYQVGVITPAGEVGSGSWSDWQGTVDRYIGQASWKVKPGDVPTALRPAWMDLELGNYGGAAAALAKARKSKDNQAAIDKLNAAISGEFSTQYQAAQELENTGDKWGAFKRYQMLAATFKSIPVAKQAKDAETRLGAKAEIASEQKAMTLFLKASKMRAIPGTAGEKRVTNALKKISDDYPDTEAGKKAKELLATR